MNKINLVFVCLFSISKLYSQKVITESNYLKEDSILWANFTTQQEKSEQCWKIMPGKRDILPNISLFRTLNKTQVP